MSTNRHDLIRHLAILANLPINEAELDKNSSQLESIMEYMDQIKSLSLDTDQATARISSEENVLRKDVVTESFTQEQALHNASHNYQGYFVVNRILDKE